MFIKYNKATFSDLNKQHNIFALVGNGFDIAVLNKYEHAPMTNRTTCYSDFFDFIEYYRLSDSSNILFQRMREDKENQKENWSDFENTIHYIYENLSDINTDIKTLEECIDDFQSHFTEYLNSLISADLLLKLNSDAQENKLATQTLSYFLRDIPPNSLDFASSTKHYDLFNFVFANFNYTPLLENYLFLDKKQFDPHLYRHADRNFSFHLNNKTQPHHSETVQSSYALLDIIHPHGIQGIPRSILFGIDIERYDAGTSVEKRLVKGYWAQYEVKYEPYLREADLFIIYGMSFGKSDAWWMDKIFDQILSRNVELLIYKFGNESEDDVKNTFLDSCLRNAARSEKDKEKVKRRITVKTFDRNNTYFLGFEPLTKDDPRNC